MRLNCFLQYFAYSFFTISLFLWATSCNDKTAKSGLEKGVIEYKISYPGIDPDNYMLDLMPKKMETSFYQGSFRSDIVAGMGLFKTSIICEKNNDQLIHSVKMLNKKYASTMNEEQIKDFSPDFNNISIEFLDETKLIAGFNCKAALVKVQSDSLWTFKLYFTDEINMDSPNKYTPFKAIDGVLMQYEILSYDTHMVFTAQKVNPIEDSINIKLEDGYEQVSPERLKQEIEAIFATVK